MPRHSDEISPYQYQRFMKSKDLWHKISHDHQPKEWSIHWGGMRGQKHHLAVGPFGQQRSGDLSIFYNANLCLPRQLYFYNYYVRSPGHQYQRQEKERKPIN